MIVEGLLTTLDGDEDCHLAAMGAEVVDEWARLVLRPYQTSRTHQNLRRTRQAVFHVTDDVEMIAQTVVGHVMPPPPRRPAPIIAGVILEDACRWYALTVESIDESADRAVIACRVVAAGRQRDFCGMNRAQYAVVEAAILATRLAWLPRQQVEEELRRLRPLVDKTGGPAEHRAFALVERYVQEGTTTSE